MIRQLAFRWYAQRSRYVEALAQLRPDAWPSTELEHWACYRLNMYDTVVRGSWNGRSFRGGVAKAVSLAACGRNEQAIDAVRHLSAHLNAGRRRMEMAQALASFNPDLAISLLGQEDEATLLRISLLLRLGERQEAARLVIASLDHPLRAQPEIQLLANNALGGCPSELLVRLNTFLAAFDLAPVALKDKSLPPTAANLMASTTLPSVRGPLISVLMTAHNSGRRIGAALDSLLAQTWQDLEVVVVDDASTDDTFDVVRAMAACDKRIRVVRLPINVGTYAAKTVGLLNAGGEFVTCHDSDDWSHPRRLELQVRPLLRHPEIVASTSLWVRIDDEGRYTARLVHPLMRINPASPLFRKREVLENAGLWDTVRTGADSEFLARLKLVFGRQSVRRVAQPLTLGAHRSDSLMTATGTGYDDRGVSPQRLAYWEAWMRWHIASMHVRRKPVMPALAAYSRGQQPRPFGGPVEIQVPPSDVLACLNVPLQ